MMGWDVHHMGVGGWLVMALIVVVVLGSVGWLVTRSLAPPHATGPESAEETLDGRFARGDIDEATYRARRAALRNR